jgi:hypothetical protein
MRSMTQAQAREAIRAAGQVFNYEMTFRRTEAGDFRVAFKDWGATGDYFTNDMTDAVATAQRMAKERHDNEMRSCRAEQAMRLGPISGPR